MGILTKTKEYIKRKTIDAAKKAADGIAAASSLSPRQISDIEAKREAYLSAMPHMTDEQAKKVADRQLGAIGIEVYQDYLAQLKTFYSPTNLPLNNFDELNRIRYFDITKWVNYSEEKNIDKLVSTYQVLSGEDCSIALIFQRTVSSCRVFLAVSNNDYNQCDPAEADAFTKRLADAFRGNFPGVEISARSSDDNKGIGVPAYLKNAIRKDHEGSTICSVASISNLASERTKDFASQGIEKLLDGIVPRNRGEEYLLILLASPDRETKEKKDRLFDISSTLSPYASWQTNYTFSSMDSQNSSANFGANAGGSAGGQFQSGSSDGVSKKILDTEAHRMELEQRGKKPSAADKAFQAVKEGFGLISRPTESHQDNFSMGASAGVNFGVNFSRSSNITRQVGANEGIVQTFSNAAVQHANKIIDSQIKRLDECAALGMWDFAAYVISESTKTAEDVAHNYLALTQGDESHLLSSSIHLWDGQREASKAETIIQCLQKMQHPVFSLMASAEGDQFMYPVLVTPSVGLTGKELALSMNFPQKSVNGLPVLESTSFGRQISRFSSVDKAGRKICIGNIYHMRTEESSEVTLDVDSIAAHVFVTGSTGSGKSNTIYQILDALHSKGVKYLVVEPAKGEYKKVFGGKCRVYGAVPTVTELLRINPFSFPLSIHVLEHVDRLIEILNACWPMYAAMPAILKEAVISSYEKVGWDVSNNICTPRKYPTFADLMQTLPSVLESKHFSADTGSDYEGALLTRIGSLTNGLNGQIFCGKRELSDEDLFENDVIVDLSRAGSPDNKALIMGVLVLKLQEYRIHLDRMNEPLVHVTVLEEAHNLLRKTSIGQTQEGANLQGKSVEMITNSIAEMRTYGEGFIIADQAPALLDDSVIRNTNTKIALRLPELSDRKTVGASMALSDKQIDELAKLPKGVAAVYQNDWVEAVLCQFKLYPEQKICPLQYEPPKESGHSLIFEHYFRKVFGLTDNYELSQEDADIIREWIDGLRKQSNTKVPLIHVLTGRTLSQSQREVIAYNLFDGREIGHILESEADERLAIEKVNNRIGTLMGVYNAEIIENARRIVLQVILRENPHGLLAQRYKEYAEGGRVR